MTAKTDAERKRRQRERDKKPGARFERTYRATENEHAELARTLKELRSDT